VPIDPSTILEAAFWTMGRRSGVRDAAAAGDDESLPNGTLNEDLKRGF
jgi:hypothetical protein